MGHCINKLKNYNTRQLVLVAVVGTDRLRFDASPSFALTFEISLTSCSQFEI